MSRLTLTETTTIDRYKTKVTVAKTDRDKAAEVTQIAVDVTPLVEDDGREVLAVDVRMSGYLLAANGKRLANGTLTMVYGDTSQEDRFNLAREAMLETFERHGFDLAKAESLFTQPWDEFRKAALKSLGF